MKFGTKARRAVLLGILTLAVLAVFSGCEDLIGPGAKTEVTVQGIVDTNYITALTAACPGVTVIDSVPDGSGRTTVFFRFSDGGIVECEEGEGYSRGVWGDLTFEVNGDGSVTASAPLTQFQGDPPAVDLTDSQGESFWDNTFLLYGLLTGESQIAVDYDGDEATVYTKIGEEENMSCTCTVDAKTLRIKTLYEGWNGHTLTVTTADPAQTYMPPTRAAAELGKAAEELRTLTYHVHLFGEEGEYAFRVPGSWEFVLGAYGDISFYEDAGLTKPTENKIPADGQDREIWVSDAKG